MTKNSNAAALDPQTYEKLGVFYLGRPYDLDAHRPGDGALLYDSRDLLTHAVCVGMTGSGKTGLCIGLIEEAALDGIPALVIDPKGDLGNLLLTFPELRPEDFLPWVNEDEARRAGVTVDELAVGQSELWRKGLESWGQDGERIRRLRQAADFTIFTPGSEAGLTISVLASFAAPPSEVRQDLDLFRERIGTTVSSLLGLLGLEVDPIQSREHILLSLLLEELWSKGQAADLGALIRSIQTPPVQKVGVVDVDSFFPAKERQALAMRLNNLLASPGFQGWLSGTPLDIGELLYTRSGKPRVAVLSIAHLAESERMFFVSLLLNELVSWMRTRSGTTSLRALLYMDEIFGFMPPVAEPPSKKPLLTLLKQARAYGVGVVLATQNPVDLDYKGLSNAGTWFIGRLQTERDKARMLEGLEGVRAPSGLDRQALDALISGLEKRIFLLHNVHEDRPVVFETRWVMSYLRGPLTRPQIRQLMADRGAEGGVDRPALSESQPEAAAPTAATASVRPVVEPGVIELFETSTGGGAGAVYRPCLLGEARVSYLERRSRQQLASEDLHLALPLGDDQLGIDWSAAEETGLETDRLLREPDAGGSWLPLPQAATKTRSYRQWQKELTATLYRDRSLQLFQSTTLGLMSEPGESERDFRIRVVEASRERRDAELEKLRQRHAKQAATLEEKLRRARERAAKEQAQASQQKLQTAISVGATVLSLLTGRKRLSQSSLSRAGSAMRGFGRSSQEAGDVELAEEAVENIVEKLEQLEGELKEELDRVAERIEADAQSLTTVAFRPRKSDVDVRLVALLWRPV